MGIGGGLAVEVGARDADPDDDLGGNLELGVAALFASWPGNGKNPQASANGEGLRFMGRLSFTHAGLRPYVGFGVAAYEFAPYGFDQGSHFLVPSVWEVGARTRSDVRFDLATYLRLTWVDPWREGGRPDDPAFFELGLAFMFAPPG